MKLDQALRKSAAQQLRRVGPTLVAGLYLSLAILPSSAQDQKRGRKYKEPPPVAHISVIVTRASNGKPVENAAIIFHTFHEGKDEGNMEIKTDEDGKAVLDVIPLGDDVQMQVFKSGFQTYGERFTNDRTSREFAVQVKPPAGQYSIYQSKPLESTGQQSVTPQPTQGTAKSPSKPN